jgi:hypothetical protein
MLLFKKLPKLHKGIFYKKGDGSMKRFLLLPIAVLLIILLSACTENAGAPIEPNENNMIINIKNNANFDFYGLEAKILNHSLNVVNADGSKIEKGEELRYELLKEDFELDGEIETEIFILTNNNIEDNGDRIPISKKVTLDLVSNKEIYFEITGDSIKEADIQRIK